MDKYRIVTAGAQFFEDFCRIEKSCFSDPWSSDAIASAIFNSMVMCLALIYEEKAVGFAMICTVTDESELLNLAVEENYRNKGFAAALMDRAEKEAIDAGADVMYLEVRESNAAASNLYKKIGFSEIGRRKKYYRRPTEDAVIMEKKLKQRSI